MINRLKRRFPSGSFGRNVLILMTGTTIAQAIPIAISPILTRIYTPEDFGIFALYMSIASIVAVIATGRYELAIMLPKKDNDAINIVALSIIITFFVSFISFLIVFVFNSQITNWLGNKEISNWLYFIPITVLLTGIYQSFNYWSNRQKQYKRLAISRVIQTGTTASSNIGMGFSGFGASGLIVGGVLGQGIATYILGKLVWKEDSKLTQKINKLKIFALAKRYIDFPKINMLHSFLNDAKGFSVNILLIKFYDAFMLGQFYLVNRILLLPSTLIGTSISQVFFRYLTNKYNQKQDISKDVLNMIIKLFLFALIPFFIIVFFGKFLFVLFFGENWAIGGELASSFALYVLFHFVASPISVVPLILNKQKTAFYWNLTGVICYVGSIFIGYIVFKDLSESLLLLSVVMAVYFLLNFVWVYEISKVYKVKMLDD
jgi:O-antigen/teichoic acid export membrane protein